MRTTLALAVAALVYSASASAQGAAALGPVDGARLSPMDTGRVAVGTAAPDFTLMSRELQLMYDKITETDGQQPTFRFLSDSGHRVIDRYGLFNQYRDGVPHPTTYVLDPRGVVRWKKTEIDYKTRPTNEEILGAVDAVLRARSP